VYQFVSLGGNVISLSSLRSSSKVHSTGHQPQLQRQSITHLFSIHLWHLEFCSHYHVEWLVCHYHTCSNLHSSYLVDKTLLHPQSGDSCLYQPLCEDSQPGLSHFLCRPHHPRR